jgi:hypothetical protein
LEQLLVSLLQGADNVPLLVRQLARLEYHRPLRMGLKLRVEEDALRQFSLV